MFLVNSRHPLACAPDPQLPEDRASFLRTYGGNLPSSFNVVLSSALVFSTRPPVSVYGTVLCEGYFQEPLSGLANPIRQDNPCDPSHTHWLRNIDLIPIGYASRPRLRGRLTLLRLTLSRNPWAFGDRVSHSVCRYSCHHNRFCKLQCPLQDTFNAPICALKPYGLKGKTDSYRTLRYRRLRDPKLRLVA